MGTSVFRNIRIFDGERVLDADTVTVTDGVIARVGDSAVPPDAEVVDGHDRCTLLPGFIDAHTHVIGPALRRALVFGVTTELDMANLPEVIRAAKEADGTPSGARQADVRSAGAAATVPGGHGTQFFPGVPTLTEPSEAEAFVAARVAEGSDYIKIHYVDGGRASALAGRELPVIGKETMAAVAAAARERGLLSLAHIGTLRAAHDAIDAGVSGLAHAFVDRAPGEGFGAYVAEHGVFIVSTLVMAEAMAAGESLKALVDDPCLGPYLSTDDVTALRGLGAGSGPKVRVDLDAAYAAVRAVHEAGAAVLAGTDAVAVLHGAGLHRELELLVLAGMEPAAALAAATTVTARVFGLADRGRIAPGLRADLLLVNGDPTRDIRATRDIAGVWKRGARVEREPAGVAR